MHLGHIITALSLCIVRIALASPTNITSGWATFYDDEHCTLNPGIAVSMTNPGCLNENGRRSFHTHKTDHRMYQLIVSPTRDCPCQSSCRIYYGPADGPCVTLDGDMIGRSYRWLAQERPGSCPGNQC